MEELEESMVPEAVAKEGSPARKLASSRTKTAESEWTIDAYLERFSSIASYLYILK